MDVFERAHSTSSYFLELREQDNLHLHQYIYKFKIDRCIVLAAGTNMRLKEKVTLSCLSA